MPKQSLPRRVCILYSHDHERHVIVRRQLASFAGSGYDAVVVDHARNQIGGAPRVERFRHRRIPTIEAETLVKGMWRGVRRLPSASIRNGYWMTVLALRTLVSAMGLAILAVKERPQVYVAEDLTAALGALMASRFHSCPVIYCAHELESEQGTDDRVRRGFLRWLQRLVIPRVDCVVVPNRSRAEFFEHDYQPRRSPIVIQNCPPTVPRLKTTILRERLGLGPSTRLVLYHGAMIPLRALDKLVCSAQHFDSDIALVLIGEQGPYFKETLAPLTQAPELRDRVYTLPYVPPDEVSAYVASADLGVVIYENVNLNNYLCAPTKLYEYIMMQIPFIACDFPGINELLREYNVGFPFNPDDQRSIALAVNTYFRMDDHERERVSEALGIARRDLNWERESLKWTALLREFTEGAHSIADQCPATLL